MTAILSLLLATISLFNSVLSMLSRVVRSSSTAWMLLRMPTLPISLAASGEGTRMLKSSRASPALIANCNTPSFNWTFVSCERGTSSPEATILPDQALSFDSNRTSHQGSADCSGSESFQVPAGAFSAGLSLGLSTGLSPGLSSIRAKPDRARVPASSTPPSRAHIRRSINGSFQGREAGMAQNTFPSVYGAPTRTQATRPHRYTGEGGLFMIVLTDAAAPRFITCVLECGDPRGIDFSLALVLALVPKFCLGTQGPEALLRRADLPAENAIPWRDIVPAKQSFETVRSQAELGNEGRIRKKGKVRGEESPNQEPRAMVSDLLWEFFERLGTRETSSVADCRAVARPVL